MVQPGSCQQYLLCGRFIHDLPQTKLRMNTSIVVRSIAAAILIILGLLIVLVSVTALIDPVGTKHADDADPFGPAPSWLERAVILLLGCGVLAVAYLLIRSAVRRARAA